jgi:hypothetical protein
MSLNRTLVVSVAWMLAILVVGLVAQVESWRGWFVLSLIALGPSLTLMHFGKTLALTTSEAIDKARR